jgi:hypothetical protein
MFGVKINEFDNSDGRIETFNRTFPKTTLGDSYGFYVEIGDIVESKHMSQASPFIRELIFFDKKYKEIGRLNHDFGQNNFYENEDYLIDNNIRFKYFVKDLNGNVIAKAYNWNDLAKKLNCDVGILKRRFKNKIKDIKQSKYHFFVTRKEL